MGAFKDFYFGYRKFADESEIVDSVKHSKLWNSTKDETIEHARALKLFENNHKRSWLVATNRRVYKILDDKREERPLINWSLPISKFSESLKNGTILDQNKKLSKIIFAHKPDKKYSFDQNIIVAQNAKEVILQRLLLEGRRITNDST